MTHFLLTNENGDYLALGSPNSSNYHGMYVKQGAQYVKVLANILPEGRLRKLYVGPTVTREFDGAAQRINFTKEGILTECTGDFTVTLDCKHMHDESEEDRQYHMEVEHAKSPGKKRLGSMTIVRIHYPKTDIHIVLATTMKVTENGAWRHVRYSYDERRGTMSTPWVYDAFTVSGHGLLAVSVSTNKKTAEQQAFSLLLQKADLKNSRMRGSTALATASLRGLYTKQGVMAGLPWFYKEWSRDELISCGGMLKAGDHDQVIKILKKWYDSVDETGLLPAIYPAEGLTSTDAPGWLAKRTLDILASPAKSKVTQYLPDWRDRLDSIIHQLPVQDSLVWNDSNETWMDTDESDDGRAGARIEIQALAMTLCDAHTAISKELGEKPSWNRLKEDITSSVHERLTTDVLHDGLSPDGSVDMAVRPNLFIAWYVQPGLFTKSEWKKYFTYVLQHCWLGWGGLASISTQDSRFQPHDTGEHTAAYHRGDSWYWVNNMAALALHKVGGFSEYVHKIELASKKDLSMGFLGHCSEISSADHQEAMGCWCQAWSASTLLELLTR